MARPCLTAVRFPSPVCFSHESRLERNAQHELRIYTHRQAHPRLRGPFGLSETCTNVSRVERILGLVIPDGAADPGPPAAKFKGVPALRLRHGGDEIVGEITQTMRCIPEGMAPYARPAFCDICHGSSPKRLIASSHLSSRLAVAKTASMSPSVTSHALSLISASSWPASQPE